MSNKISLEELYANPLSNLHYDIIEFVKAVEPTRQEITSSENIISVVEEITLKVLGSKADVKKFGSYAMDLSTHHSDIDLVILNILTIFADGYTLQQRAQAVKILYTLAKTIVKKELLPLSSAKVVPKARVPLLKLETIDGTHVDLSVYHQGGVKAARHIREEMKLYPALKPLCLVLKSYLKERGLTEVSDGGLGGYALAIMVLAHCKEMRLSGEIDIDYGYSLFKFLEKFGHHFDYIRQAVSSRRGGILRKKVLEKETKDWIRDNIDWQGKTDGKRKLFIEDPMNGVNLAISTTRWDMIKANIKDAYKVLGSPNGMNDYNKLDDLFNTKKFTKPRIGNSNLLTPKKMPTPIIKSKLCVKNNAYFLNGHFVKF